MEDNHLLAKIAQFYEDLSNLALRFVSSAIKLQETVRFLNFDVGFFISIKETILSMKILLNDNKYSDFYTLLRKYQDMIITNIYLNEYAERNFSLDNIIVENIDKWVNQKNQLPNFGKMLSYICENQKIKKIYTILNKDNRYNHIRKSCNDYVHLNSFKHLVENIQVLRMFLNELEQVEVTTNNLIDLFILHFSLLLITKEEYFTSTDYVDSLEAGIMSSAESIYYVAPFVSDIFDDILLKRRNDVAKEIKKMIKLKI